MRVVAATRASGAIHPHGAVPIERRLRSPGDAGDGCRDARLPVGNGGRLRRMWRRWRSPRPRVQRHPRRGSGSLGASRRCSGSPSAMPRPGGRGDRLPSRPRGGRYCGTRSRQGPPSPGAASRRRSQRSDPRDLDRRDQRRCRPQRARPSRCNVAAHGAGPAWSAGCNHRVPRRRSGPRSTDAVRTGGDHRIRTGHPRRGGTHARQGRHRVPSSTRPPHGGLLRWPGWSTPPAGSTASSLASLVWARAAGNRSSLLFRPSHTRWLSRIGRSAAAPASVVASPPAAPARSDAGRPPSGDGRPSRRRGRATGASPCSPGGRGCSGCGSRPLSA